MGKSKNILFYYKGLRSFLLYSNLLKNYPNLFDVVIEMPAIPFSRKTKKKDYKKIIRAFFQSPDFVLMQFLIINFFSFFNRIFKKSIYHICLKNKIEHKFFHKIECRGMVLFINGFFFFTEIQEFKKSHLYRISII